MSSNEQAIIYSEVYSVLNMLGDNYINLLPKKLYDFIKDNKNGDYIPIYDINKPLSMQNIKKRTASFLCLLHYKYWCQNNEEKLEIIKILNNNEKRLKEKYNTDNIFNNKTNEENIQVNGNVALVEKKENTFTKILNYIKNLCKNNK